MSGRYFTYTRIGKNQAKIIHDIVANPMPNDIDHPVFNAYKGQEWPKRYKPYVKNKKLFIPVAMVEAVKLCIRDADLYYTMLGDHIMAGAAKRLYMKLLR